MLGWLSDMPTSTCRRKAWRNAEVTASSGRTIFTVTGRLPSVSIASVITVLAPAVTTFSMRYRSPRTRPTRVSTPVGVGSGVSVSTAGETLSAEQVAWRAGIMDDVTDRVTDPDAAIVDDVDVDAPPSDPRCRRRGHGRCPPAADPDGDSIAAC